HPVMTRIVLVVALPLFQHRFACTKIDPNLFRERKLLIHCKVIQREWQFVIGKIKPQNLSSFEIDDCSRQHANVAISLGVVENQLTILIDCRAETVSQVSSHPTDSLCQRNLSRLTLYPDNQCSLF